MLADGAQFLECDVADTQRFTGHSALGFFWREPYTPDALQTRCLQMIAHSIGLPVRLHSDGAETIALALQDLRLTH